MPEGMNNKTKHGHTDARVGHVESGPGMRERHVKIEKGEINDVAVHETVGQVAHDSAE